MPKKVSVLLLPTGFSIDVGSFMHFTSSVEVHHSIPPPPKNTSYEHQHRHQHTGRGKGCKGQRNGHHPPKGHGKSPQGSLELTQRLQALKHKSFVSGSGHQGMARVMLNVRTQQQKEKIGDKAMGTDLPKHNFRLPFFASMPESVRFSYHPIPPP